MIFLLICFLILFFYYNMEYVKYEYTDIEGGGHTYMESKINIMVRQGTKNNFFLIGWSIFCRYG